MPTFDHLQLPSGNVYEIADAYARGLLAGGLVFEICWDGQSAPDVTKIPAGVKVTYNETEYTGTKAASTAEPLHFYLVFSPTQEGTLDHYDEYAAMRSGSGTEPDPYVYTWEKIGDTNIDLSNLGALAYKDTVTLNKSTAKVLGKDATFSATAQGSSVSFSGGTDDKVLGADTTFNVTQPSISVTPSTTHISATPSGITVGATGSATAVTGYSSPSSDTFVKSVSASTSKMVTTTVTPISSVGTASDWSFTMGTGANATTLIISGGNGTAPTAGSAVTVATGSLDANGSGATVATGASAGSTGSALTGLGDPSTASVVTGVEVTSQGSVALATGATAGTGVVEVATGISSASASGAAVSANNNDEVTAVTGVGTATAAAQSVSVSVNSADEKTVLTDSTSVSVS